MGGMLRATSGALEERAWTGPDHRHRDHRDRRGRARRPVYNGLVTRRNRIDEALGQIEVQLKRRHDLIPNLVEAVKGYMGFEQTCSPG